MRRNLIILIALILLQPRLDHVYICRFSLATVESWISVTVEPPCKKEEARGQVAPTPGPGFSWHFCCLLWLSQNMQPCESQVIGYLDLFVSFCSDRFLAYQSYGLPLVSYQESFSRKWHKPRSNCKKLWAQKIEKSMSKTGLRTSWIQEPGDVIERGPNVVRGKSTECRVRNPRKQGQLIQWGLEKGGLGEDKVWDSYLFLQITSF